MHYAMARMSRAQGLILLTVIASARFDVIGFVKEGSPLKMVNIKGGCSSAQESQCLCCGLISSIHWVVCYT